MQRTAFSLVVLVTLGLFGLVGLVLLQPQLLGRLLGPDIAAHAGQHFRSPDHRIHDLTFSFLFGTAIVGLLAQLRRPSSNVAGQLMALIPWAALGVVIALTNYWNARGTRFVLLATAIYGGLTLVATTLHPTGRYFLRSFSISKVNPVMLALTIGAAVPLLIFAWTNIGLQRALTNQHVDLGHYGFMAAFSFTVIGVALLASLRPAGWRIAAWTAGVLPVLLGLTSMAFPVDSQIGRTWVLAAIAWGVTFVAATGLTPATDTGHSPLDLDAGTNTERRKGGESTSTPLWVRLSGITLTILVLLLIIMHFANGGLSRLHTVR